MGGDWQRRIRAMLGGCLPTKGAISTHVGQLRGMWVFNLPDKQLRVHWPILSGKPNWPLACETLIIFNSQGNQWDQRVLSLLKGCISRARLSPCCCKHAVWKLLPAHTAQNLFSPNSFWYLLACIYSKGWCFSSRHKCPMVSSLHHIFISNMRGNSSSRGNVCHHERKHSH